MVALTSKVVSTFAEELLKKAVPDILDSIRGTLGHTNSVMAEVEAISSRTAETREDVFLKSLSLYEVALEAKQKGQRLVLVGPDYRFIREIVGFGQVDREPVQSETNAR